MFNLLPVPKWVKVTLGLCGCWILVFTGICFLISGCNVSNLPKPKPNIGVKEEFHVEDTVSGKKSYFSLRISFRSMTYDRNNNKTYFVIDNKEDLAHFQKEVEFLQKKLNDFEKILNPEEVDLQQ